VVNPPSDTDRKIIAEYARRKKEFQLHWNRNMLTLGFPGFILFGLGGLGEGMLGRSPGNISVVVALVGFAIFAFALARGVFYYSSQYLRCPVCNKQQSPAIHFPYRSCDGCGQRLSEGWKDSG